MNAKNCLTAAIAALATMAIVLAANWPSCLDAKGPAPAKPAARAVKIPTLTVHGCKLSILPQNKPVKSDQDYVISIKAVNTTDKPVSFDMTVAVQAMSVQSMFSRGPAMPKESWRQICPVSLVAGETAVINVVTGKKASALGHFLTPRLTVDGKHLRGPSFGVPIAFRPAPRGRTPNGNIPLKQVVATPARRAKTGG